MKTTKRLISLFVGMLFATTMMADVVYEPMIVDSGFNRDVIKAVGSDTAISALYYSGSTSCFGTQSIIAQCNSAWETSDNANYVRTVRSGWSDNYLHVTIDSSSPITHNMIVKAKIQSSMGKREVRGSL